MNTQKITDIVDHNYVSASVLYYFGIYFYNYSEKTLEQVCLEKGLNTSLVIKELEKSTRCDEDIELTAFPIDLILEYLRHTHYVFIKRKLPYITQLIESFEPDDHRYNGIAKDLKLVFPMFVEDFIHHIYMEEDTLFTYIRMLCRCALGKENVTKIYQKMEKHSLHKYAVEHEEHDDEMRGIRKITDNYKTSPSDPLHIRVVYAELQALEQELVTHARVENEILFPKALMLEQDVKKTIKSKITLN
ncbi:iron-sulfur cluster repair di-iron protein [Fulvivirga sp. M361]|nr:iron-sulfur cluster repair di-iron protein [Fulvivirga sp. M361]